MKRLTIILAALAMSGRPMIALVVAAVVNVAFLFRLNRGASGGACP